MTALARKNIVAGDVPFFWVAARIAIMSPPASIT